MYMKPCTNSFTANSRGFTLIELMSVVLIISIIGMIAYPNYRDYVLRAARSEAKGALISTAAKQEQYFINNKTYTTNLANLGITSALTEGGKYQIQVSSATASAFSLTAVAQGGQAEDTDCLNFTLDSNGTKGVTGSAGAGTCW